MFRESSLQSSMERRTSGFRPFPRVQTKLARGSASGAAERDADAMASHVMAGQSVSSAPRGLADSEPGVALSPQVATSLGRSKGGGAPLADSVRQKLEPRFGFNFADVRVHSDAPAHAMNQALGARAFTHGSDIYLSPQVRPDVNPVMAHELAHVTQQTGMLHCQKLPGPAAKEAEPPRVGRVSTSYGCLLKVYAKGGQEYINSPATGKRENIPDADLHEGGAGGNIIGHHGLLSDGRPFWDFLSSGQITGNKKLKDVYTGMAASMAADWLEMPASGAIAPVKGASKERVIVVRRVNVVGGADPRPKYDDKNPNQDVIGYNCTYEFFTKV